MPSGSFRSEFRLSDLIEVVFKPGSDERALTFLVDLPSSRPDNPEWKARRDMAFRWYRESRAGGAGAAFKAVYLCCYGNVLSNNGDLPESVWVVDSLPTGEGNPPSGEQIGLKDILGRSSVVIAPTELSATAPLKILARKMSFRGATLPGFTQQMLPALSLDYEEIHARVMEIKRRMDESVSISCVFKTSKGEYQFTADTRFRTGHASGGLIREAQSVGNLPSGEAYIVPYEGERGEPSLTSGLLPVQFGEEIVIYKVAENRVTSVLSSGESSRKESDLLSREPAYGNIAEVGIGVLGEWGVLPAGSILLDEKLGLHIAFGRSDHFGGVTGPASFRDPANVVHIDRVYVPSLQPGIHPSKVEFMYPSGESEIVIKDGALKI